MPTKTPTTLPTLSINYLTQAQYETALNNGEIEANEFYITEVSGNSVTVAENVKTTKYYPVLATEVGTATRQIDTNDKLLGTETAGGLYYQNATLGTPGLQVGDIDYTISNDEYDALDALIDALE